LKETTSSLLFYSMEPRAELSWRPLADIYRTREGWVIKVDLAGVRPQDISILGEGTQLRISGIRHDWFCKEGWSYYMMEIPYSRFERTIDLPCSLDRVDIGVECNEGLLLLFIKAKEETKDE
jgi:HSP20 family protein